VNRKTKNIIKENNKTEKTINTGSPQNSSRDREDSPVCIKKPTSIWETRPIFYLLQRISKFC